MRNVEANYSAFKEAELAKSKLEIYENSHQISFMENVRDYFDYTELDNNDYSVLARDKDKVLDRLYRHNIDGWNSTVTNCDEISDFLRDYCDFHSERGSEM